MDDQATPEEGLPEKNENILDLNFVPTWARKPPENPYADRDIPDGDSSRPPRERRDGRRGFERGGGGGGGGGRRGPGMGDRRSSRGPRDSRRTGGSERRFGDERGGRRPAGGERPRRAPGERGGRGERTGDRRDSRGPRRHKPQPRLDVKVSFLPNRDCLALVVRDIQASRRAFPLIEIASRFLGREDLYLVKLEWPVPAEGTPRQTFAQCLECKRVFRQRANAEAHILNEHLDKYFTTEEVEVEPPSGSFSFVGRCRLSGTLLGPPNHHGYNEKIQEVWSSRFAHMSKADYLGHIETVRDEALVAQWLDSLRKKTVYRLKEVPEGEEAQPMTAAEAQDWFRGGRVNAMIRESVRCMIPGPQASKYDDPALQAAVAHARQRESRFPFTLSLALRPAFRHMRLHLFKVNARETYVTAIAPKPVDLATAPDVVKEIIRFLEEHPGSTRQQVLEGLRAGYDPESAVASELLLHLDNLIINGGVIEFFNGTLALPRGKAAAETEKKAEAEVVEETPAEESPPEPPPATEASADEEPVAEESVADETVANDPAPETDAAPSPEVSEEPAPEPPPTTE